MYDSLLMHEIHCKEKLSHDRLNITFMKYLSRSYHVKQRRSLLKVQNHVNVVTALINLEKFNNISAKRELSLDLDFFSQLLDSFFLGDCLLVDAFYCESFFFLNDAALDHGLCDFFC